MYNKINIATNFEFQGQVTGAAVLNLSESILLYTTHNSRSHIHQCDLMQYYTLDKSKDTLGTHYDVLQKCCSFSINYFN